MKVYNTGETEEDLRSKYNPEGSPLREAQMRMLDMLTYIDEVCRSEGIQYRLDSGNVIGALRHGGFIPWDDDVDVAFSRQEYRRFRQYLASHPHPQYVLQTPGNDIGYLQPWDKLKDTRSEYTTSAQLGSKDEKVYNHQSLKGLHVDLFVFEDHMVPALQRLAGKIAATTIFSIGKSHWRLARCLQWANMRLLFPCFRLWGRLFGNKNLVMYSYGTYFYKQYPKQILLPYKDIVYEGRTFKGPANPQEMCRIAYGNYMDLPPEDKRRVHASEIRLGAS